MTEPYDVVVAGGGPAGAATGLLFARRGYRVAVLEQAHFPREKTCAEYLSPGVLQVLRRLGVDSAVLAREPASLRGMEIVSPSGNALPVCYGRQPWAPQAMTVPRVQLDAVLVSEAVRAGAELMEGFRVSALEAGDSGPCRVEGIKNGDRCALAARLAVIADGARSGLARGLGLASAPRWPVRLGLVAHFAGPACLPEGFGQMHVAAGGYCGVAPLPAGSDGGARQNVAMVVRMDSVKRARVPASTYFERWIAAHPRLQHTLSGCTRVSGVRGVAPVGSRCARPFAAGALVVGDAAGFFDPFTGEGIYRALRSAELAADVGGRALRSGDLSERALSEYGRARRRHFRRKEAVTALVQLFVQCPPLLDYAVPRLKARDDAPEALGRVLGDLSDASEFMRPAMLWRALRP